jgi:hypothetical protein
VGVSAGKSGVEPLRQGMNSVLMCMVPIHATSSGTVLFIGVEHSSCEVFISMDERATQQRCSYPAEHIQRDSILALVLIGIKTRTYRWCARKVAQGVKLKYRPSFSADRSQFGVNLPAESEIHSATHIANKRLRTILRYFSFWDSQYSNSS